MKFDIKSKHVFILIMVVAGSYILFGVAQAIFHFMVNPDLEKDLSTGFFVAVAVLYFYMNSLRKKETAAREADKAAEQATPAAPAMPEVPADKDDQTKA